MEMPNAADAAVVCDQITHLVASLSKRTYQANTIELCGITEQYGETAETFVLERLIAFHRTGHSEHKTLLREALVRAVHAPSWRSRLSRALAGVLADDESAYPSLQQLCGSVDAPWPVPLLVGACLVCSDHPRIQADGLWFFRHQLEGAHSHQPARAQERENPAVVEPAVAHKVLDTLALHPSLADLVPTALDLLLTADADASADPVPVPVRSPGPRVEVAQAHVPLAWAPAHACLDMRASTAVSAMPAPAAPSSRAALRAALCAVAVDRVGSLLAETGPSVTSSEAALASFLDTALAPSPRLITADDIAACLTAMATSSPADPTVSADWDATLLVQTLLARASPSLSWDAVLAALDRPDLRVPSVRAFGLLAAAHAAATAAADPHAPPCPTGLPLRALCGRWRNTQAQVHLLMCALQLATSPEVWDAPVVQTLLALSASPQAAHAGALLTGAAHAAPDHVLRALATLDSPNAAAACPLAQRVARTALAPRLAARDAPLVAAIAPTAPWMLAHAVAARLDAGDCPETVVADLAHTLPAGGDDTTQDAASVLAAVVAHILAAPDATQQPHAVALQLAAASSAVITLPSLDAWLTSVLDVHGAPLVEALLAATHALVTRDAPLSPTAGAVLSAALAHLFAHAGLAAVAPETLLRVRALHERACARPDAPVSRAATPDAAAPLSWGRDMVTQVSSLVRRLLAGTLPIDDLLALLARAHPDLVACLTWHAARELPEMAPHNTARARTLAVVLGRLLQRRLVRDHASAAHILAALRTLLDTPHASHAWQVGWAALVEFLPQVVEWPDFAAYLAAHPLVAAHHPETAAAIQAALPASATRSMMRPVAAAGAGVSGASASVAESLWALDAAVRPRFNALVGGGPTGDGASGVGSGAGNTGTGTPSFPRSVNIDTLLAGGAGETQSLEAEEKDTIHFIFNNLTEDFLDAKVAELEAFLQPRHYGYLAQYLVVKRASIEPNFHDVYLTCLERLGLPDLVDAVLGCTYENIGILLQSEKIKTSSSERSLLKNLGSWLGLLTLARNKPVLYKMLPIKALILEAYSTGRLIAIIPFVAKILAAATRSKVFAPPNPWTMGIIRLLAELFNVEGLKLNLKFQIEVLCNQLSLDLSSIVPDTLLHRHVHATKAAASAAAAAGAAAAAAGLSSAEGAAATTVIPNLGSFIKINPTIGLFQQHPQLQTCVLVAVDRAIREILTPVVDRSVTIACVSARELILKDFAMQPDEQKMRAAAQSMVQYLAGSLALVTCKDPLNATMTGHLRTRLQSSIPEATLQQMQSMLDAIVSLVVQDNLELACHIVEKAAMEKAAREIENALAPALSVRRKHRERTGQPYYDTSIFTNTTSRFPSALPEPLRPKPGAPVPMRVYDDFAHRPRAVFSTPEEDALLRSAVSVGMSMGAAADQTGSVSINVQSTPAAAPAGAAAALPLNAEAYMPAPGDTGKSIVEKFMIYLESIDHVLVHTVKSGVFNHSQLAPDHPLSVLLSRALLLFMYLEDLAARTDVLLACARIVYGRMWEIVNPNAVLLYLDTYVTLLQSLVLAGSNTSGLPNQVELELTRLLLNCDARHTLYETITTRLIFARAVSFPDLDGHLAKQLQQAMQVSSGRDDPAHQLVPLVENVIRLVHRFALEEPIPFLKEFPLTVAAIQQIVARYAKVMAIDGVMVVLDAANHAAAHQGQPTGHPQDPRRGQRIGINSNSNSSSHHQQQQAATQAQQQRAGTAQAPGGPGGHFTSFATSSADHNDPPDARERVAYVLEEWARISQQAGTAALHWYVGGAESRVAAVDGQIPGLAASALNDPAGDAGDPSAVAVDTDYTGKAAAANAVFGGYVQYLKVQGLMDDDGTAPLFFRVATEMAIEAWMVKEATGDVPSDGVDALSNLLVGLVKWYNRGVTESVGGTGLETPVSLGKIVLLRQVLAMILKVLLYDYERQPAHFNQKAYSRLLTNLLVELTRHSPLLDALSFSVLSTFASAFLQLRPERVPGFAFAWLSLISHRSFMPKILLVRNAQPGQGWHLFQHLIVALLRFLHPLLRQDGTQRKLSASVRHLYKGTLRVLLVLLHDFPEFLCDYHFVFCDAMPASCVQMRNLILSAFPRNMRLPDPFLPNLQVEMLPEINQAPRVSSAFKNILTSGGLGAELDSFLHTRQPQNFAASVLAALRVADADADAPTTADATAWNVPLINALVLYLGIHGVTVLSTTPGRALSASVLATSPAMALFKYLCKHMDPEGRYLLLNGIANQLRFPNSHTHYFSSVLLLLFLGASNAAKEQITRVLLERLIVNRPHPWGLLITFIDLIKNPKYQFWNHSFTRVAPDIERLFELVAGSCMGRAGGADVASLRQSYSQQGGQGTNTTGQPQSE